MGFPQNPVNGQTYRNYIYDATDGVWEFNPHYGLYDDMPAENARELVYNNTSLFEKDGYYWFRKKDGSGVERIYCDMTTDWGGWMRIFTWDHNKHGIPELQPHTVVNENQVYIQDRNYLYFSGGSGQDLKYSFPVITTNYGEVKLIIHWRGYSMEDSGFYWYAKDSSNNILDLECKSSTTANSSSYFPRSCSDTSYNGSVSETINTTFTNSSSFPIELVDLVWHMQDNGSGDRSYLYNFEIWVR